MPSSLPWQPNGRKSKAFCDRHRSLRQSPDELPGCSTPRRFVAEVPLQPGIFAFVRPWRLAACLSGGRGFCTPRQCTGRVVRYGPRGLLAIGGDIVLGEVSLVRSGGDLLSHVLRRSTIGVGALIGRVRDGIGSFALAMTTRPEKRPGFARSLLRPGRDPGPRGTGQNPNISVFQIVLLTIRSGVGCATAHLCLPCCFRIRSSQSGN